MSELTDRAKGSVATKRGDAINLGYFDDGEEPASWITPVLATLDICSENQHIVHA
jgi:hypothetical protein